MTADVPRRLTAEAIGTAMLLAAHDFGCVREACLVAALTQGRDLLLRGVSKEIANVRDEAFRDSDVHETSDFFVLMRAY